jgi:exopolyphosphatase/guanosine-5'-triphosphate,3'-diphosphate pyrophosphatase
MAKQRKLAPRAAPAAAPPPEPVKPVGVIDIGASAIRLVVAEASSDGQPFRVLEEASRGVLLGKETFTHGRIGTATVEAAVKALEGFRRIMDSYGVERYRAVATSAVREAQNNDAFLDRVRLRTGIDAEIIDGSEENRLSYVAVRDRLRGHPALTTGNALLVEVGGGSADISYLRQGQPIRSGTYALGSIRMRQSLGGWQGSQEQGLKLLTRYVHNIVEDIRAEIPIKEATHFVALGGDVRYAASRILDDTGGKPYAVLTREAFVAYCGQIAQLDTEHLVEKQGLPHSQAETLVPALLAYRELLLETPATEVIVPDASLRVGLLIDLLQPDDAQVGADFERQVLASAASLGERYRYDAAHANHVALLGVRIFDQLREEHGLSPRHRLLLQVAGALHDIGIYVNLRGHHKHSAYLISVSEVFGLTRDDMAVVANISRYHRRAIPQKSHLPYMALDRQTRVEVNKLAAILRLANALDADHSQKVKDVRITAEEGNWVMDLEGTGDLTMEKLAAQARADLITEVFGRKVAVREDRQRTWS